MHLRSVFRLTALIQLLLACFMLIPTAIGTVAGEDEAVSAFLTSIAVIMVVSAITIFFTRKGKIVIKAKDSYLLVTLTWVLAAGFGALPLYLSKVFPTFMQCYFEIMSGFTTTGATALTSIEDKPMSILFWRNMTNWLGGMGIVVLFVAILPLLGVRGTNLVSAESVGPTKEKLTPKIQQTAFALWLIYLVLSVIETIFLLFGGLSLFDAVTVTFGTMGAAGFAALNDSIGGYNSAYVDVVVTVFMLLSGANFALYFKIIKGKFRQVAKDSELRVYLGIIAVTTLLITINLLVNGVFSGVGTALRYSAFQVTSVITTTGFSTANYDMWPTFSKALLFLLFFVGGCAGSAGGGIKVVRVSTMLMLARNTIRKRLHPNAITPIIQGDVVVAQDTLLSIAGFVGTYIMTGLFGFIAFSLSGYDFETCFSASFLLLGNIGIAFGEVSPAGSFAIFNNWLLAVASFLMLVGRLELFTVYALFTKQFWQK